MQIPCTTEIYLHILCAQSLRDAVCGRLVPLEEEEGARRNDEQRAPLRAELLIRHRRPRADMITAIKYLPDQKRLGNARI